MLVPVRQDEHYQVLAEHPDRIHPRELSSALVSSVGENRFKVALRRNIYVIYVYCQPEEDLRALKAKVSDDNLKEDTELLDYQRRLQDFKLAEQKLREARLSRL
jgi:hypothetical protein